MEYELMIWAIAILATCLVIVLRRRIEVQIIRDNALIIVAIFCIVFTYFCSNSISLDSNFDVPFNVFNLSVIGISLSTVPRSTQRSSKWRLVVWVTALFSMIFCAQSLSGLWASSISSSNGPFISSLLVGNAFSQGPGHVIAVSRVWDVAHFEEGNSALGMQFVAIGYVLSLLAMMIQRRVNKTNGSKKIDAPSVRYSIKSCFCFLFQCVTIYVLTILFLKGLLLGLKVIINHDQYIAIASIFDGLTFVFCMAAASWSKKKKWIATNSKRAEVEAVNTSLIDLLIIAIFLSVDLSLLISTPITALAPVIGASLSSLVIYIVVWRYSNVPEKKIILSGIIGTTLGTLGNGFAMMKRVNRSMESQWFRTITLMNFYSGVLLGPALALLFSPTLWINYHRAITLTYASTFLISLVLLVVCEFGFVGLLKRRD